MSTLKTSSEKLHIALDFVKEVVSVHHEYEYLLTAKEKKKLEVMPIDLDKETAKRIHKMAKELKVTDEAVIIGLLERELAKNSSKKKKKS